MVVYLASQGGVTPAPVTSCSAARQGIPPTPAGTQDASTGAASSSQACAGSVALSLGRTGPPYGLAFWGQPLPTNTPTNSLSSTYVSELTGWLQMDQTSGKKAIYNGLLATDGSPPLYVVPSEQPRAKVYEWVPAGQSKTAPVTSLPACTTGSGQRPPVCSAMGESDDPSLPPCRAAVSTGCDNPGVIDPALKNLLSGGVPIPSVARPAVNSDLTLNIYQPSTNTIWELYRVQKDTSGNWLVGWAGVINNVSSSNGVFPHPFGTAATGISLVGTTARVEELQSGRIDHPLELDLPIDLILHNGLGPANAPAGSPAFSWPANRDDGHGETTIATNPARGIPEGIRFRLSLTPAQIDALHLSPVARTIALAVQRFGLILMNGDPNAVIIKLGNPEPYCAAGLPDPYKALFGSAYGAGSSKGVPCTPEGDYSTEVMQSFPWGKLVALPYDFGKSGSG